MCTILPVVTSIFSIVPKLFYDLSGEKKEKMYRELYERRMQTAKQVEAFNEENEKSEA